MIERVFYGPEGGEHTEPKTWNLPRASLLEIRIHIASSVHPVPSFLFEFGNGNPPAFFPASSIKVFLKEVSEYVMEATASLSRSFDALRITPETSAHFEYELTVFRPEDIGVQPVAAAAV